MEGDEIWSNIVFARGLKGTANISLTVQELDGPNGSPTGVPVIDNFSYTEDSFEQFFFTRKTVMSGRGFYQVSIRRVDNANQDSQNPDQATIESISAISNYTDQQFGDNTMIRVQLPATINATSLRENQINLTATSRLITYANGAVDMTRRPSRKMADALLHLYVVVYELPASDLALDELYEIQNRLDAINPVLATFDFTFDDIDVPLQEQMESILQVARCFLWRDGGTYRFGREEVQEFESTLITRRDIASPEERNYSITYNPQLLSQNDSVKVEYVNPTTNKKAYIYRRVDPATGAIIDGAGLNPIAIQLTGCSQVFNATNRAELEIRKLVYQRWTLVDTLTSSGLLIDRGDLVLYANQYEEYKDVFDGEILAIDGDVATTSESLEFLDGRSYRVHYTRSNGEAAGAIFNNSDSW